MAGIQSYGPTIGIGQIGEPLHRGSVDALLHNLLEAKDAALACTVLVRECDGRRRQSARRRPVTVAD